MALLALATALLLTTATGAGWAGGPVVQPLVAQTTTVVATADGYVWSSPLPAGVGGGEILRAGVGGGYGTAFAVVKFTLPSLPAGATLSAATLRFTAAMDIPQRGTPSMSTRISEAPVGWTEDDLTWEIFSGNVGQVIAMITITGRTDATYDVDVKETVQGWLNGTRTNNGFIISPVDGLTGDFIARIWSRERGGTLAPQLTLTYDAPATPTPTPGATGTPTATPPPAAATPTPTATPIPTVTPTRTGPTRIFIPIVFKARR
jgi:hypothetical protein